VTNVKSSPTPSDSPLLSHSTSRRILVVDDDIEAADALARILRQSGHVVQMAHDGIRALTAAAIMRPEVVILDIGMPGLDGYQVAQRLRAGVGANALIVALTGYGQPRDLELARQSGFDYHLLKPLEREKLEAILRS
jgi:CheY-like chemotaxis protein